MIAQGFGHPTSGRFNAPQESDALSIDQIGARYSRRRITSRQAQGRFINKTLNDFDTNCIDCRIARNRSTFSPKPPGATAARSGRRSTMDDLLLAVDLDHGPVGVHAGDLAAAKAPQQPMPPARR
jgi:hypothetical protein